jgi:hypothetical protein
MKFCANSNGTLFLIDRDRIGDLGCVCDGVYEAICCNLSISSLISMDLEG